VPRRELGGREAEAAVLIAHHRDGDRGLAPLGADQHALHRTGLVGRDDLPGQCRRRGLGVRAAECRPGQKQGGAGGHKKLKGPHPHAGGSAFFIDLGASSIWSHFRTENRMPPGAGSGAGVSPKMS
jgi:hypothetical protein